MKQKKIKKFLSLAIMMGLSPIVLGSSFFVTINPNSYNVIEGGGNEGGGTNPPIEPEKPLIPSKLWLEFIHSYGNNLNVKDMNDFNTNEETILLFSKSLTNEKLPKENLGLTSPYNLYFHNNKLTNIEFLNGIKSIRKHLYIQNNDLINLKGLETLEKVDYFFQLYNLKITNVNELKSLKSVLSLHLHNNKSLKDLTGLSNLENGNIYIDSPIQYVNKPNMNSLFCKNLVIGNVKVYRYGTQNTYPVKDICN